MARRFIGVFLPDCKFSTTTVLGEVDGIEFKVTGKEILEPGWRVVRGDQGAKGKEQEADEDKKGEEEKKDNEASLLRAMETAGKFVEDETLRAAMKENGIGRPSSRASIIETLFKRHYIRRERKRLVATPTGIELIDLIREELLKSCELTGIWEKKLRDIEAKKYDAAQFIQELKDQVTAIVHDVISDPSNRRITITPEEEKKKRKKGNDADKQKS